MSIKILTLEDLKDFKSELLGDLQSIIKEPENEKPKKWIKSSEVRKLLSISAGTLQNLRINGTLPYTKFGSVIYYNAHLINEILENNQIQGV